MGTEERWLCEEIYDNYCEALRRIAINLQVSNEELDDVIQETFISYFENYSLDWTSTQMKASLVIELKRQVSNSFRKNGTVSFESMTLESAKLLAKFYSPDLIHIAMEDEGLTRIADKILHLKSDQKETAILYFLDQRTVSEICEILNITKITCYARIYKVRKCLRKIVSAEYKTGHTVASKQTDSQKSV